MNTVFKLNDGTIVPEIGFGPGIVGYSAKYKRENKMPKLLKKVMDKFFFRPSTNSKYVNAVSNAFKQGFRLLDYSAAYGDGILVRKGIEKSGISRKDLFITTRVSNHAQREKKVKEEFFNCMHNLGVDYVDLLQFHWPVTGYYLETWRAMEELYEEGYVKHLGVANCHQHHLEEIFKICKHRPEIGQFEIHPLFTQKPLIEYYKKNGILVEAYTPIARYDDRLVRLPLLRRLEEKYNKSFIQIILRWHIQNGVIPLVRSMSIEHQKENLNIFDFELEEEDMALIDGININSRLRYDPDNCDFSIL